MLYRELGNSGVKVSAVSFGSMRYSSEQNAHEVINRGLDLGMNYIDTSSGYVGGNSEKWSGAAVRKRRGEIYFSSKSNWCKALAADGVRAAIEKSLANAGLDYFDFYQLWGLEKPETLPEALVKGGFIDGVRQAQKDGLIRHGLGFTFHGNDELFRAAIDTGEFCCATVSYNLMNRKEESNIAYAASKGVGVIIMNPMAGGLLGLAGDPSLDFLCPPGKEGDSPLFHTAEKGDSPLRRGPWWGALRFLLANPAIATSIIGSTWPAEVDMAAAALEGLAELGSDFRADLARRMDQSRKDGKSAEGTFCTGCGYCKECPHGFNPTRFMQVMRDFAIYGVAEKDLRHWILSQYPHQNVFEHLAKCTECGECQLKCPQHLQIVEMIRKVKSAMGVPGK